MTENREVPSGRYILCKAAEMGCRSREARALQLECKIGVKSGDEPVEVEWGECLELQRPVRNRREGAGEGRR